MKELYKKIINKIKKSNLVKLIKSKSIINELNEKIDELQKDKQKLIDKILVMENDLKKLDELENKVPSMEIIIASADKTIKEKNKEIKSLNKEKLNIQNDLFETKLQLGTANAQIEEYEAQIKDLKSDRYLIKKVKPGKTPNTNKTKISKPMSARVTKFMREEHE